MMKHIYEKLNDKARLELDLLVGLLDSVGRPVGKEDLVLFFLPRGRWKVSLLIGPLDPLKLKLKRKLTQN